MLTDRPLLAETNGKDFSWHKYWSRKPSSLVGGYIAALLPPGGRVIDPCCGSGVSLFETLKAGGSAVGIDVNPVACEISRLQVNPPRSEDFKSLALNILTRIEEKFGTLFEVDSKTIRFVIHQVVTRCNDCGTDISASLHERRPTRCKCGTKVSFSLKSMTHTTVGGIQFDDGTYTDDPSLCLIEKEASLTSLGDFSKYSHNLVENRRTLSFRENQTKDFFTSRNFSIICLILEEIHTSLCDDNLRQALRLWITGSSAQLSRLTAWRNGLTSGGPAWTVPGFWVPPVHLECNPFLYLRSRIDKLAKSFASISEFTQYIPLDNIPEIRQGSALEELRNLESAADIVFFDPPYGDSVAFTEFSVIWNGLLQNPTNIDSDISISDREDSPFSQFDYNEAVLSLWNAIAQSLRPGGRVVSTFHNHNAQTWASLVEGFQNAGLRSTDVEYHDPAVISTKAQFSPEGSYIGDFYLVLERSDRVVKTLDESQSRISKDLSALRRSAYTSVTKSIAFRFALELALKEGVRGQDLVALDSLVNAIDWSTNSHEVTKAARYKHLESEISIFLDESADVYWRDLWASVQRDRIRYVCASQREIAETLSRMEYSVCDDGLITIKQQSLF